MVGTTTVLVAFAHAASADSYAGEYTDDGYRNTSESIWRDPAVYSGVGIGVNVGGGVFGFTDPALRALTPPVGGMWSFRSAFGTHIPLGVEVGYMGSANQIEGQFGRASATLFGTTLETALRYNIVPRSPWSPYAFIGVGWQHYQLDDRAFQLSDTGIANQDDLVVIPVGAGISYRRGAIVTDLRGTFRAATNENLVLADPEASLRDGTGGFAPMHQWDASLNVGYEF